MPFKTWCEVNEIIENTTGPATKKQRDLGVLAGILLSPRTPRIVAAAMLRAALRHELNLPAPRPISSRYDERIRALRRPHDPLISSQTEEEAEAWVNFLRLARRRESLVDLKIQEGDIVKTTEGVLAEVSSIGQEGRVFFKGGQGFGSWPDQVTIVARRNEIAGPATEARKQAQNFAARHTRSSVWSTAKRSELSEFATEAIISEDDIVELESIISAAEDERPIQKFLESNGHLLTALLGGPERYCLPKKRLGGEYIPDFVIGDVNSQGIRWVLIELETPRSGIYLKSGLELDERTRKGLAQVVSWRSWLSQNIAYASKKRSDDGIGLFDIREKADAIVLVGRRSQIPETKDALRHALRQENNIRIHTYDWLLDTLRGAVQYVGPPGSNPYLIPRRFENTLTSNSFTI